MTHDWTHAISFPKSGKTWTKFMVARVIADHSGLRLTEVLDRIGHQRGDPGVLLGGRPAPYFSHSESEVPQTGRVPASMRGATVHLLVRDPRDVLVSHYLNETFGFKRFTGSLSDFIRFDNRSADPRSPEARFGLRAILTFMNAFIEDRPMFARFAVATYEGFRADPRASLAELCVFLGLPTTPAGLDAAVEFGGFDNMRRLEDAGDLRAYGLQGAEREEGRKVRSGRIGGYREQLTPDQADYIEEVIERDLHPFYSAYRSAAAVRQSA